jgi:lipoprotein-anchoring transpeptidase ErfK/SrfK
VRDKKIPRVLEFDMMLLRGLIWSGLVLSLTPELVSFAKAEEPPAAAATAAATMPLPAIPTVKIVPAAAVPEQPAMQEPTKTAVVLPPPAPPKPIITLQAKVDLGRQTLTVTERGKAVGTWKISSGGSAEFATPRGVFKPEWTAKMWFSKKYDDAPMPNAVFFKNGAAIHATQAIGRLGTPASHGCVRLSPANAETFYKLVQRHGLTHTQIHVFGDAPYPQHVARAPASTPRTATVTGRANPYGGQGYAGWSSPPRSVRYATASPFASSPFLSPTYVRLPISAARNR